ncbi:hypothetical protein HK104_000468 [Borealophlyctis nickersoniae]|nr:hypothetical protein HK104_000468 [Borealophlyctis nickersoniae]
MSSPVPQLNASTIVQKECSRPFHERGPGFLVEGGEERGFIGYGITPSHPVEIPEWTHNPAVVAKEGAPRFELTLRIPDVHTRRVYNHLLRRRRDLLDAHIMVDYDGPAFRFTGPQPCVECAVRDCILCCDSKGYAHQAERVQYVVGTPRSQYGLQWVNRDVRSHDGGSRWNMMLLREYLPDDEIAEMEKVGAVEVPISPAVSSNRFIQTTHHIGISLQDALASVVSRVITHLSTLSSTEGTTVDVAVWYGRSYFYPSPKVEACFQPEQHYPIEDFAKLVKERTVRTAFINRTDPTFPPFCEESMAGEETDPYTTTQDHVLQLSLIDLQNPSLPDITVKIPADPHFLFPATPAMPYNAPFIPPKSAKIMSTKPPPPVSGPQILSATRESVKTFVADLVSGPDRFYHDVRVGVSRKCLISGDTQIEEDLKTYLRRLRCVEVVNTGEDASKKKRKRARIVPCLVDVVFRSSAGDEGGKGEGEDPPTQKGNGATRYIIKHARRLRRTIRTSRRFRVTLSEIDEMPGSPCGCLHIEEGKPFRGVPEAVKTKAATMVEGLSPFWEVTVESIALPDMIRRKSSQNEMRGLIEELVKKAVGWNVD